VASRKRANPALLRNQKVIQLTQLLSSRSLAIRRNDQAMIESLNQQMIDMGADPDTGELVSDQTGGDDSAYDAMIQRINDKNQKRNKDAMIAAHQASVARQKAEAAVVKARQL
jgi:RNA polymerase-associated protein RTF1